MVSGEALRNRVEQKIGTRGKPPNKPPFESGEENQFPELPEISLRLRVKGKVFPQNREISLRLRVEREDGITVGNPQINLRLRVNRQEGGNCTERTNKPPFESEEEVQGYSGGPPK